MAGLADGGLFSNLEELDLSESERLNPNGGSSSALSSLERLLSRCPKLATLSLAKCGGIFDVGKEEEAAIEAAEDSSEERLPCQLVATTVPLEGNETCSNSNSSSISNGSLSFLDCSTTTSGSTDLRAAVLRQLDLSGNTAVGPPDKKIFQSDTCPLPSGLEGFLKRRCQRLARLRLAQLDWMDGWCQCHDSCELEAQLEVVFGALGKEASLPEFKDLDLGGDSIQTTLLQPLRQLLELRPTVRVRGGDWCVSGLQEGGCVECRAD